MRDTNREGQGGKTNCIFYGGFFFLAAGTSRQRHMATYTGPAPPPAQDSKDCSVLKVTCQAHKGPGGAGLLPFLAAPLSRDGGAD